MSSAFTLALMICSSVFSRVASRLARRFRLQVMDRRPRVDSTYSIQRRLQVPSPIRARVEGSRSWNGLMPFFLRACLLSPRVISLAMSWWSGGFVR